MGSVDKAIITFHGVNKPQGHWPKYICAEEVCGDYIGNFKTDKGQEAHLGLLPLLHLQTPPPTRNCSQQGFFNQALSGVH